MAQARQQGERIANAFDQAAPPQPLPVDPPPVMSPRHQPTPNRVATPTTPNLPPESPPMTQTREEPSPLMTPYASPAPPAPTPQQTPPRQPTPAAPTPVKLFQNAADHLRSYRHLSLSGKKRQRCQFNVEQGSGTRRSETYLFADPTALAPPPLDLATMVVKGGATSLPLLLPPIGSSKKPPVVRPALLLLTKQARAILTLSALMRP